jgi:hypothetical protein
MIVADDNDSIFYCNNILAPLVKYLKESFFTKISVNNFDLLSVLLIAAINDKLLEISEVLDNIYLFLYLFIYYYLFELLLN